MTRIDFERDWLKRWTGHLETQNDGTIKVVRYVYNDFEPDIEILLSKEVVQKLRRLLNEQD
jgi:hypothetical protein